MAQRKRYVIVGADSIIAGTGNDVFIYEEYDTQSAFLEGAGGVNSSQSAYLTGPIEETGSTHGYLAGEDTSSDSQSAFLSGTRTYTREVAYQVVDSSDDDVDDTSNQAVVATLDTPATKVPGYLEGEFAGTSASDSKSAYLNGRPVSFQSAYLKGGNAADSSVPAYLSGPIFDSDSTSAYLTGIERASQSVFTKGSVPAFTKYKTYTISEPDETITDFILTLNVVSNNDLRTVANGGYVENTVSNGGVGENITVPCDMVFADDKLNETVFDFEWEWYDPATGGFTAHIRIPTLSTGDDRTIYITFGNSNIDHSQENIAPVWGTDYKMVLHLAEASGTRLDSTIYNRNATPVNSPGRTDGAIIVPPTKWAAEFSPADSDEALEIPWDEELSNMDDGWTVEIWLKTQDTSPSEIAYAIGMGDSTDGWGAWLATYSKIQAYFNGKGNTSYYTQSSGKNLWGIVWDKPNSYWRLYRDLVQTDSYYDPGIPTIDEGQPLVIGGNPEDTDSNSWYGWIDEVRFYRGIRTAAWFKSTHGACNSYATLSSTEDVTLRSDTPAFLEGYTAGVSSNPAYLEGTGGEVDDSQAAYLSGVGLATDSKSAYLAGPTPATSSFSAYLSGPVELTNSQSAYMEGNPPPETNSVHAFLWADWPEVPPAAESSTHGYLKGDGTFPFSDNFTGADGNYWNNTKWDTGKC